MAKKARRKTRVKKPDPTEQMVYGAMGVVLVLAIFWLTVIKPFIIWVQANPLPGFGAILLVSAGVVGGGYYGIRLLIQKRRSVQATTATAAGVPPTVAAPAVMAAAAPEPIVNTGGGGTVLLAVPDQKLAKIEAAIRRFRPARSTKEFGYHRALWGFLQNEFPDVANEVRGQHGRPDIVIGGIAIEVKGPTTNAALINLPGKAAKYLGTYRHLFMVLFEPAYDATTYNQISQSLARDPRVTIIVKEGAN